MLAVAPFDFHRLATVEVAFLLAAGLLAVFLAVRLARAPSARLLPYYAMAARPRRRSAKSLLFASGAMDRRESLRRRGQRVKVQMADAAGQEALGTAWVVDRSTGGLGLLSAKPLPIGRVLCVQPVHATSRMPWVEVEVKCCRGQGVEWEIGCRFLRRPSWNMLLLFG